MARVFAFAVVLAPLAAIAVVRGDRLSHLSDGQSASEYWDIVAHFDSNHHLFARFLITNEGPGDRTAIATWQLIDPNGKRTEFRNGRRKKRWTLSPGGDRIEIGSSVFDQSGPLHRLEYDSTKRGIRVAFQYVPKGPVAWPRSASDRYPFDLLELTTPVTGTIWLEGMNETASVNGTITITHTWMEESEADLTLRRIDFASTGRRAGRIPLGLDDAFGRTRALAGRPRAMVRCWYKPAISSSPSRTPSTISEGYPTHGELRISGSGSRARFRAARRSPRSTRWRRSPTVPIPVILQAASTPSVARASFGVRLRSGQDGSETVLKGSGITTITYTNPLPLKVTQPETRIQELSSCELAY